MSPSEGAERDQKGLAGEHLSSMRGCCDLMRARCSMGPTNKASRYGLLRVSLGRPASLADIKLNVPLPSLGRMLAHTYERPKIWWNDAAGGIFIGGAFELQWRVT